MRPIWSNPDESAWRLWWKETPKDELVQFFEHPKPREFVSDTAAVFLALAEALKGEGNVSPNPLVGCVIRSIDNLFLAVGAHLKYGGPHAETQALSQVDEKLLFQAKVNVTLEPCSHFGKTPPCADALARLPLSEVKYLVQDPNPLVRGTGAAKIAQAGIKVIHELQFSDLGEKVAEMYLFSQRNHKVFVGLKAATSQEGIYALDDQPRQWITNDRSREYGHYLRQKYDAILVGTRTVLIDDPMLNIRSRFISGRTPLRVVLDPLGQVPSSSKLLVNEPERTLLLQTSGSEVNGSDSFRIKNLPLDSFGKFKWQDVLELLWNDGVRSVLIEGGGGIWKDSIAAGVVNRVHWFMGRTPSDVKVDRAKTVSIPQAVLASQPIHCFGLDEYYEVELYG